MSDLTYGEYPTGGIRATVTTDEGTRVYMIPPDEANKDYQAYLSWVAEGNTATALEDPLKATEEP